MTWYYKFIMNIFFLNVNSNKTTKKSKKRDNYTLYNSLDSDRMKIIFVKVGTSK